MTLTHFGKYFFGILGIIIAFTILNVLMTYQSIRAVQERRDLVAHSKEVDLELQKTAVSYLAVIANEKAYLLTQNDFFFRMYKTIVPTITTHVRTLNQLADGTPSQKHLVGELSRYIVQRIAVFDREISVLQSDGFDAAHEQVRTDISDNNALFVSAIMKKIEANERAKLQKSEVLLHGSDTRLYITVTIGGLLGLGFTLIAGYLIYNELRRRSLSEQKKDDFISVISHELKTPITSMSIFSQLLEREVEQYIQKNKKQKIFTYIHKVQAQIARQQSLIDDLADISKLEAGEFSFSKEEFDIHALVKDTVEVVQTTTKSHKITVKGKIKRLVYADKERVRQVLINFLSNAIKYSPDAKRVTVIVYSGRLSVRVSVQDYGIGIPKDKLAFIFERFYRVHDTNRQFPGLGLGLYISSEIIHKLGGAVSVKSKVHTGSIFTFTLPYKKTHLG